MARTAPATNVCWRDFIARCWHSPSWSDFPTPRTARSFATPPQRAGSRIACAALGRGIGGRHAPRNQQRRTRRRASRTSGLRTSRASRSSAFRHATGKEGLAIIDGQAGTGKSFTMAAIREAYEKAGYRVIGLGADQCRRAGHARRTVSARPARFTASCSRSTTTAPAGTGAPSSWSTKPRCSTPS